MIEFLASVGLDKVSHKDKLDLILYDVMQNPDDKYILGLFDDDVYVEYAKFYGDGLGLNLRGTMDKNEQITVHNYFAIAETDITLQVSSLELMAEQKESEVYGICEEHETGNEFIFYLQNYVEYLSIDEDEFTAQDSYHLQLTALADSGTIVLPIAQDDESDEERTEEEEEYKELVMRSRSGDQEASELLMQNLIETNQIIQERLKEEDFLSIVRGYFIPLEEEKARYYLLGDITQCDRIQNRLTKEYVLRLTVDITGTPLQIFIAEEKLVGVPMVGMRYIGTCWLQGKILFSEE